MQISRLQLEKIYDELYDEAEQVLKEFNPCEHKVNKNGEHLCLGKETKCWAACSPFTSKVSPACCCINCKFWDSGCKAEKPLQCKLWLCSSSFNKYPKVYDKLEGIRRRASSLHLLVNRGDKKESIEFALSFQ